MINSAARPSIDQIRNSSSAYTLPSLTLVLIPPLSATHHHALRPSVRRLAFFPLSIDACRRVLQQQFTPAERSRGKASSVFSSKRALLTHYSPRGLFFVAFPSSSRYRNPSRRLLGRLLSPCATQWYQRHIFSATIASSRKSSKQLASSSFAALFPHTKNGLLAPVALNSFFFFFLPLFVSSIVTHVMG